MVDKNNLYNQLIEKYSGKIAELEKEESPLVTEIEGLESKYRALVKEDRKTWTSEYRDIVNNTYEELHESEKKLNKLREDKACYALAIQGFEAQISSHNR